LSERVHYGSSEKNLFLSFPQIFIWGFLNSTFAFWNNIFNEKTIFRQAKIWGDNSAPPSYPPSCYVAAGRDVLTRTGEVAAGGKTK